VLEEVVLVEAFLIPHTPLQVMVAQVVVVQVVFGIKAAFLVLLTQVAAAVEVESRLIKVAEVMEDLDFVF
jgi:hypothetical protein